MTESEKICRNCPMRRDSNRRTDYVDGDPADWYQDRFSPSWKMPKCIEEPETICLGALIHVLNEYAVMMLPPELKEIAIQYEEDHLLIFSANNEFIRYHRGEDFGSKAWYERTLSFKYSKSLETEAEAQSSQGELF